MTTFEQFLLNLGLTDLQAILPVLVNNPAAISPTLKAILLAVRNSINELFPNG